MRALLFHCKKYRVKIDQLANRPKNIKPENVSEKEQICKDCVVALITIEKSDNLKENCLKLSKEISQLSTETKHNNIVLLPFAHLSNNLASTEESIEALDLIEGLLRDKHKITRSHFGSHKELLIDTYGHPGNARYREFK